MTDAVFEEIPAGRAVEAARLARAARALIPFGAWRYRRAYPVVPWLVSSTRWDSPYFSRRCGPMGRPSVGSMARIATDFRRKAYRAAFWLYGRCCPGAAARAATSLWLTVPRRPFRPGDDSRLPPGLQFGVNVDGGVVRGTRWGSGPLVYLVHGWAGSSAQFAGVVETLVAAGFCVVAFDAPNHGRSGPGPSGRRHTHVVEFGRALAGVVHRHGPAYAVVAHSLGAVATGLAVRSGWVFVPRLVLLAPLTEVSESLDQLAEQLGLPDRVRPQLDSQVLARTGHPVDDFRLDRMLEEMAEAPVLVLDGDNKIQDDPDVGRVVAQFLEGARLRAVS